MSVHAVTPYSRMAGSSRVRVFDWVEATVADVQVFSYAGHRDASPKTLLSHPVKTGCAELELRRLIRSRPARLMLHRGASPFSSGRVEEKLLNSSEFSVYDFDDALQWDYASFPRSIASKPKRCTAAVRSASLVIAGNDVLADWATEHSNNVIVIPSCVEPARYVRKKSYALSDPPRLVWVGSPSTEKYLKLIEQPLLEFHRKTGSRLTVVSAGARPLGELDKIVDRVEWNENSSRVAASADIALAPLTDTPFARGKCAYKILEYGAGGLPTVGSPVGANLKALATLGGVAVEASNDWGEALLQIVDMTEAERAAMGQTARQSVEDYYSFSAWKPKWLSAVVG